MRMNAEQWAGWWKSGGEPRAVQTLRVVRRLKYSRSVWTAVALAPFLCTPNGFSVTD